MIDYKKAYAEKLKDPRWQKCRLKILERDNFTCTFCGDDKSTLHIHHIEYIKGIEPWEYDNDNLKTMCEKCHELQHLNCSHLEALLTSIIFRIEGSSVNKIAVRDEVYKQIKSRN